MARKANRHRPAIDQRICDALTELHVYVLVLGAELQRTEERLQELQSLDETSGELDELRHHEAEIGAQRELLDGLIAALRCIADPARRYL